MHFALKSYLVAKKQPHWLIVGAYFRSELRILLFKLSDVVAGNDNFDKASILF
ncbi:MAG: hypothetical protein OSA51_01035 [Octadecabacter sp.]|nr:hypothetical protein [Octadecabacter sp.]